MCSQHCNHCYQSNNHLIQNNAIGNCLQHSLICTCRHLNQCILLFQNMAFSSICNLGVKLLYNLCILCSCFHSQSYQRNLYMRSMLHSQFSFKKTCNYYTMNNCYRHLLQSHRLNCICCNCCTIQINSMCSHSPIFQWQDSRSIHKDKYHHRQCQLIQHFWLRVDNQH